MVDGQLFVLKKTHFLDSNKNENWNRKNSAKSRENAFIKLLETK